MAQKIIVYWRDIPAQVLVKQGRKAARRELPAIFMETVDACAMRVGAKDTDAYLAEWRRSDPVDVSDDLESEADAAAEALIAAYPKDRLKDLMAREGFEPSSADISS